MMQSIKRSGFKSRIVLLLVASGMMFLNPQPAEAGPIMDWFARRRAARQQRILARQAATNLTFPTSAVPTGSCNVACARPISHVTQHVVLRYMPETQYRTVWTQVPTTVYRPVTCSMSNGCTMTCMRPCTTSSWQARRVPYTTYRPVYQTVTVNTHMPATATTGYSSNLGYANGQTFTTNSTGCNGCSSQTQPYASPYTQGPAGSSILQNGSQNATPWAPANPDAPSLDPNQARDALQGMPNSGQSHEAQRQNMPADGSGGQEESDQQGNGDESGIKPPNNNNGNSSSGTASGLRPIPAPPNNGYRWNPDSIPNLLNGNGSDNETARLTNERWAAVPISWPTVPVTKASYIQSAESGQRSAPSSDEKVKLRRSDNAQWRPSIR